MLRISTPLLMLSLVLLTLSGTACRQEPQPEATPEPTPSASTAEPTYLETPYTAEQIRDAWVEGLSLRMMNETSYGKQYQRWTVVSADEEGVDVEYVEIDAEGEPIGPSQVRRSLWVELRDHARYPAEVCMRTEETRQTPLGELDGWVYTLTDDANDAVTEYFFAHSMPGAPVQMVVTQGGTILQKMTQLEREVRPRP